MTLSRSELIDTSTARHRWLVMVYRRRLVMVDAHGSHYRYENVDTDSGGWPFKLIHPPQVGDVLHAGELTLRVVARDFMPSQHGSSNWPHSEPFPRSPGICRLMTEDAQGMFANEYIDPEENPE